MLLRGAWRIFPRQLNLDTNPNWQVKTFHEIFLNIMASFIPKEIKKCVPRDPPWINVSHYFAKKGEYTLLQLQETWIQSREEDKIRLESFRTECKEAVESYFSNLGSKLNEPGTTRKNYWEILHRVISEGHQKYPLSLKKEH